MFPRIYLLAAVVLQRVPAELLSGQVHFTSEASNFQTLNCSSFWLQNPLCLLCRTEELSVRKLKRLNVSSLLTLQKYNRNTT